MVLYLVLASQKLLNPSRILPIICTCNSSSGSALSKVYPGAALHPWFYLPAKFMKLSWADSHTGNRPTEGKSFNTKMDQEKMIRHRKKGLYHKHKRGVTRGSLHHCWNISWRCPYVTFTEEQGSLFISQEWAQTNLGSIDYQWGQEQKQRNKESIGFVFNVMSTKLWRNNDHKH